MAVHLLEGMFLGMRNNQPSSAERERLLALGTLSAGLTHELNNPAAAAVRATAALRDQVAGMRHKLAMIADGRIDGPAAAQARRCCRSELVKQVANAPDADARSRPPTARTSSATGSTSTASTAAGTSRRVFVAGGSASTGWRPSPPPCDERDGRTARSAGWPTPSRPKR